MANYRITGVWFSHAPNKHVSHVQLHLETDSGVNKGGKYTKDYVIQLIENKHAVTTMKWNYQSEKMLTRGADVEIYTRNNVKYLRTVPDAIETDNLDNMLDMKWLLGE